ncbi:MAG: ATP-binding protein [Pyrinomonadaceae bacterium]
MAATFNDIESPAEQSNILQKILDTTREAVVVIDSDLRIAYHNTPAVAAFRPDGSDLKTKRLSEVIRHPALHEACRLAVATEKSGDVRLELLTGQKRNFDVYVAPFDLERKKFAIIFFHETTQIDRLETVRQEFLSNISHELRTPLTSILAFVETLEDGAINDKENNLRFLEVIRRNAKRMHSLIADILELSMIESGNVSLSIRKVQLSTVVNHVFSALAAKAGDGEIKLKSDIPHDIEILADVVRLEQMLTNLVDNAIKFNRPGGLVTVSHSTDDDREVISVADTGEGLLPEHAQRIFERFYRSDRARSREVGGTGLGLAIVKHLAKLHGGEVSVASAIGSGTIFRIELPG